MAMSPDQVVQSGSPFKIGRQLGHYEEFFHGEVDDLFIYGTGLSTEQVEVLADYENFATPEPASFVLVATGLLGVATFARRPRRV